MNKKIIISIILILILILIILVIIFIPKWKGKNIDMNEIKENIKYKDTSFDFDKRYVTLNNGIKMPIIGLGTWTFTNEEAKDEFITIDSLNKLEKQYIEIIKEKM